MRTIIIQLTVVVLAWAACGGRGAADQPLTLVGTAKADITPAFPVRLNGFRVRREESEGVRQPIFVRAIAIGGDARPVVLITADTLGIPDGVAERLAAVLAEKVGLPRERLAVAATHTHTSPMLNDVSPTMFGAAIPPEHQAHIDEASELFFEKLVQVALEAVANRRPARLSWGTGRVTFAANRRTPGGPVDHDLPLLAAHDAEGRLLATLVTYACHCVCLSDNRVSGDWAGYAAARLEARHPGSVALISIGCGADANPVGGVVGDRFEVADRHGAEIEIEVERLLRGGLTPLPADVQVRWERIDLPLAALPERATWEERARDDGAAGHHARTQLARLDAGQQLAASISYPVQSWTFGDRLAMVFLPGEVVVDYATRLKRELDCRRLWIHAYANGCPGYVPSERILAEGGYEAGGAMVFYDIPGPYAPGVEDRIVAAVHRQLDGTFAAPAAVGTQGIPPRSPSESLAALHPRPGFVAALMAAEPLVTSPVAIAFGPDRRLWVAEMFDYPTGIEGDFAAGGRVRVLLDDDGDGTPDRSEVFLDDLPFPTGVTPWRDGVLVCSAPDILFARDTDGDHRADEVTKLFSGFATHNYQARVNSLEYGLDGWVYGSCGLFGGEITCHATGEVVSLGKRDFRIDPDRGRLEPVAGASQQGRVRSDAGDWFGSNSEVLLLHYPLDAAALGRNPHLAPPRLSVAPSMPDDGGLFPIAKTVLFKLSGPAGRATAACGLGLYRDDRLGSGFTGNAFTCEPVNNLVHRRVLAPRGVLFEAARAAGEESREFLASTDPWFRPVQATTGPDGGLWVVDMYRYVIEHPIWIPEEVLATLDPRAGADRGRLYRVLPEDVEPRRWPRLTDLDPAGLAAALDSENGWQRDMAQQLLLWRKATAATPALADIVERSPRPVARMQAVCTLDRLGTLDTRLLLAALRDAAAMVRRQAVRIASGRLDEPSLLAAVAAMAGGDLTQADGDPAVRLQVAYALGASDSPQAGDALATLLVAHADDPLLAAAALSSLTPRSAPVVAQAVMSPGGSPAVTGLQPTVLAQAAAFAEPTAVGQLLAFADDASGGLERRWERLAALLPVITRRSLSLADVLPDRDRTTIAATLDAARETMHDEEASLAERLAAVRLVGVLPTPDGDDVDRLASLLEPRHAGELQKAALTALAARSDDRVATAVLSRSDALAPARRDEALTLLLARPVWTAAILEAVAAGDLLASDLSAAQRQQLLDHPEAPLRSRAAAVLAAPASTAREPLVARYLAEAPPTGIADPARGRTAFEKRCASCHQLGGLGAAIGPDLSGYATKPFAALATAVLDPNAAVDPRYRSYTITLADGRVISGMILEESAAGFRIATADGRVQELLRLDVDELKRSEKSLMPEGLEQDVSPADLSDIAAWVAAAGQPPPSPAADQTVADQTVAEVIRRLVRDLEPGTPEEYRRIPDIFRAAVAAGRRNADAELLDVLDVGLPGDGARLLDWQAVVLGGGIVNGISQAGAWPAERLARLLEDSGNQTADDAAGGGLARRWQQALVASLAMADDDTVPTGTRYDALRMVAMLGWDRAAARLERYAAEESDAELQMGAVSGACDIPDSRATALLIGVIAHAPPANRDLALDGLLRSDERCLALLAAVQDGRVSRDLLGDARIARLRGHESASIRAAAKTALP